MINLICHFVAEQIDRGFFVGGKNTRNTNEYGMLGGSAVECMKLSHNMMWLTNEYGIMCMTARVSTLDSRMGLTFFVYDQYHPLTAHLLMHLRIFTLLYAHGKHTPTESQIPTM